MRDYGKLIAARYVDGRVVKGRTADFQPRRPVFHVLGEDGGPPTLVQVEDLKAVFFVKTLGGNPRYDDRKEFERRAGIEKKIWLEFTDGEELAGWSASVGSASDGFYMVPADAHSNIERAYIFRSSLKRVLIGPEAAKASRGSREETGSTPSAADSWDGFLNPL